MIEDTNGRSGATMASGVRSPYLLGTVMLIGALLSAVGMVAALPAFTASSAASNLVWIAIALLFYGAWAPNMMTVSADVAPPGTVASVTGIAGAGAGIGGVLFTLATGWLIEHVGYGPVFVLAGLLPLGAASSVAFVIRSIGPPSTTG